ncbi:MAG: alanine--tRNA ligase [Myxococcales bacterium]|nr:alanine--tRNA ligase [Myxococcales bacterium]
MSQPNQMTSSPDQTSESHSPTTAAEIRAAFLDYFAGTGHTRVDSHSLLPPADPTLLFINAGMVQFKDYFTGARPAPYKSATSTQKCLRVSGKHNDLENVGRTRRHHTLFEMLGNFSFGAYFKEGAIKQAWDFLTGTLKLDPSRLIVTYFEGDHDVPRDTEAVDIWKEVSGLPEARIVAMTAKDNFWAMGDSGPCGPCSEIYYDLWPEKGDETTFPEDEERFMEVWNLVFMQYDRQFGMLKPLPRPCVDTGMGLERIASVVQQGQSNYDTDLIRSLISHLERKSGIDYGGRFDPEGEASHDELVERDVAFRVVSDHARATAFLIADGIYPDNEGRGYVLRRVMRRAIRFGQKLGLTGPFFADVCSEVVTAMGAAFPELTAHHDVMMRVVLQEEDRFSKTLTEGERLISQTLDRIEAEGGERLLDGDTIFLLYDSNGFPTDLTALIAAERDFDVDMAGFNAAMNRQRARGRASWKGVQQDGAQLIKSLVDAGLTTEFVGYTTAEVTDAEVLAIIGDGQRKEVAHRGETVQVVLDRTPFYGEGGGQVGDRGELRWHDLGTDADKAQITDTTRPADDIFLHTLTLGQGELKIGDKVVAKVDAAHRAGVRAHHSATHILHKILRDVLGTHVRQRGSLVQADRLRFDFSHFEAMTPAEVTEVERRVNAAVLHNVDADIASCSMDEAKERGAMMFFGDKYGETVRVVALGDSVELCGGIHVQRTGDIGLVKVLTETGVSAGVRRIEAQCHLALLDQVQVVWGQLEGVSRRFNVKMDAVDERVGASLEQLKKLERELEKTRQQLTLAQANAGSGGGGDDGTVTEQIGDLTLTARVVAGVSGKDLRILGDQARDKLDKGAALLISVNGDKVALLVAVTKAESKALHAGKLVGKLAPMVGGRGGGRPDFAQAGGSDASGLDAAVQVFFEAARAAFSS